jgi:saccharopine dehydrogenase-like NADP-dependent oxidoreductase
VPASAIQITTASGICAVLDLLAQGKLPQKGFVRQEEIPLDAFLTNRFGSAYSSAHGTAQAAAARAA